MEKPEPNTQASEIPQTIAQNNITKGQVDKIKKEKKNLSVTKETIAYQDAKDLRKEGHLLHLLHNRQLLELYPVNTLLP